MQVFLLAIKQKQEINVVLWQFWNYKKMIFRVVDSIKTYIIVLKWCLDRLAEL